MNGEIQERYRGSLSPLLLPCEFGWNSKGVEKSRGRRTQHPEGGESVWERPYLPRIHLSYWR